MTIQEFISQSFKKINKQFPQAFIAYQFDEGVGTHYIKVSPPAVYDNDAFAGLGWDLKDAFNEYFPSGELCFLTDDSLIQLTSPSRVFYPDWGEEVSFEEGKVFLSKNFKSKFEFSWNKTCPEMGKGLHSEFSTVSEIPPAGNYQYAMAA
jgi:hypothetical protein